MIKIDLDDIKKHEISKLINKFVLDKKVVDEICKLAEFLENKECKNTADLLKTKAVSDLFILFGRKALNDCTIEFDNAIIADEKKTGINVKEIKRSIRYGEKIDKILGFSEFYNSFRSSDEAYEILEIIGANVCPYCNRQYTFTARKNEVRTRPQFDHFYPQALYPYLAVSIYNLIPSCALCNFGKRDSVPENILYPYEEDFDRKNINFKIDGVVPFILGAASNINVNLESSSKNKPIIDAYNKEMKISVLYEGHSKYITDLIIKKYIFNDDAINDICSLLPEHCLTPLYVEQFIFGQYEVTYSMDNPLSKLTRDVLNQL